MGWRDGLRGMAVGYVLLIVCGIALGANLIPDGGGGPGQSPCWSTPKALGADCGPGIVLERVVEPYINLAFASFVGIFFAPLLFVHDPGPEWWAEMRNFGLPVLASALFWWAVGATIWGAVIRLWRLASSAMRRHG